MSELMISADSHVIEPHDLWAERLPAHLRDKAPKYAKRTNFQVHDGGADPKNRIHEMAKDGVSAEVLYASLALTQYALTDVELQEACFRIYNDWLIEYCSHASERLFGIGLISTYRIDHAIAEVERCRKAGMPGVMVWQVPPDELAFTTRHYDPLWAVCQDLDLPVSLHILTGMPYPPGRVSNTTHPKRVSFAANRKTLYTADSLWEIIGSGTFDRFPRLKLVLVETEVSWLPYYLAQWDRYLDKNKRLPDAPQLLPTEYFARNVHATFFNDPPVGMLFEKWGTDNCMWSNDFPHGNSTWPHSREVISRDLGHLPGPARARLLSENVTKLYKLPVIAPVVDERVPVTD